MSNQSTPLFVTSKDSSMYYEINVAKLNVHGIYCHHFATAPRSLTTEEEARALLAEFREIYQSPLFIITCRVVTETGVECKW